MREEQMMQDTRIDTIAKAVVEALDGPQRNTALCRQVVRLLAQGQPVSPHHLAGALHRPVDEVMAELRTHPELEYDANGNIVGSGLTLVPTDYQVQMNSHRLFAWCALGALTNPLQLQLSARILSRCPTTGVRIRLTLTPQRLVDLDPPDAVMSLALPSASACCHDLRGTFCHESRFFSSSDAAAMWQTTSPGALIFSLEEAYQVAQLVVAYQTANGEQSISRS